MGEGVGNELTATKVIKIHNHFSRRSYRKEFVMNGPVMVGSKTQLCILGPVLTKSKTTGNFINLFYLTLK